MLRIYIWLQSNLDERVDILMKMIFFLIRILIFFFLKYLFIYLFMAVFGSLFLFEGFLQLWQVGPLLIAVRGPLTIAASLVAEHRF